MSVNVHIDLNNSPDLDINQYDSLNCFEDNCHNILKTTLEYLQAHKNLTSETISMGIYLVEKEEGQKLNLDYRQKDYATNVLSFPSEIPEELVQEMQELPIGELIICLPIVISEAEQQNKQPKNHFTHLLIHGCLHLLGYDHELSDLITEADAEEMESIEIAVLKTLEIDNPY